MNFFQPKQVAYSENRYLEAREVFDNTKTLGDDRAKEIAFRTVDSIYIQFSSLLDVQFSAH